MRHGAALQSGDMLGKDIDTTWDNTEQLHPLSGVFGSEQSVKAG